MGDLHGFITSLHFGKNLFDFFVHTFPFNGPFVFAASTPVEPAPGSGPPCWQYLLQYEIPFIFIHSPGLYDVCHFRFTLFTNLIDTCHIL